MEKWWVLLVSSNLKLLVSVLELYGDILETDVVSTVLLLQKDAENLALCVGNSLAYQSFGPVCGFVEDYTALISNLAQVLLHNS